MEPKLKFHEDPGHGWLEVPTALLVELGIADKITSYSYRSRDGATAYLEEDCDLSTFMQAATGLPRLFWENMVEVIHHAGECFVRNLPHYPAGPNPRLVGITVPAGGCSHDD